MIESARCDARLAHAKAVIVSMGYRISSENTLTCRSLRIIPPMGRWCWYNAQRSTITPPLFSSHSTSQLFLYMAQGAFLATRTPMLHTGLAPAFVTLLALGGQVGLPILVLTCLRSKRLNRHSTFVNCCITSIIYSLVFCILLSCSSPRFAALLTSWIIPSFRLPSPNSMGTELDRTGYRIYTGQYRRAEPNHALCVAQASMVMAVLPMYVCSNLPSGENKTDFAVGCPSLSSCLFFRYIQQFLGTSNQANG